MSFSQSYCHQQHIEESEFIPHVLKRVMHRPSNWLAGILIHFNQDLLRADLDLLHTCAYLTRRRDLENELAEFSYDLRNRSFWRGKLHQRISTHRLRRLFRETMRQPEVSS